MGEVRPKMRWALDEKVTVSVVDKKGDILRSLPAVIGAKVTFDAMPAVTVAGAFVGDTHGNRRWTNFNGGPKTLNAGDTLELEIKP